MGTRRLDLGDAAQALGITREAVRRRAKRGTLESERGADGRLYVWVDDDHPDDHHAGDDRDELVEELRDRVRYLEEESRRKDHLLAAALERIPPALEEAPLEARESSETASGGGGGVPPEEERRSWWQRWFGG